MLAEHHTRLPVNPRGLLQTANRALPDPCRHPLAPGHVERPGQRDRSLLLRFHLFFVARAAHPPRVLLVLGPGPPLCGEFLHIPGSMLSAHVTHGLWLRDFERLVVFCPDGAGRAGGCSIRDRCFLHLFSRLRTAAANNRREIRCGVPVLCRFLGRSVFVCCICSIFYTLSRIRTGTFLSSSIPILLKSSFS